MSLVLCGSPAIDSGWSDPRTIATLISGVVALGAAIYAFRAQALNRKLSVRPVLVFIRVEGQWNVQNIGNGPALDVLIAEKDSNGKFHGTEVAYPFPAKSELRKLSLRSGDVLVASYKDALGSWFTSECSAHQTSISNGDGLAQFRRS